jgi:hypothetical protein
MAPKGLLQLMALLDSPRSPACPARYRFFAFHRRAVNLPG